MDAEERDKREQIALRNRLAIASGLWRQISEDPLPKMAPGDPREQVQAFELALIDMSRTEATPDNARRIADGTWDLVHDRPEADPVRQAVEVLHAELAMLAHARDDE